MVYVTSGLVFLPTRLRASGGLQELGCEGGKAVPIPGSSGDHMQTWS